MMKEFFDILDIPETSSYDEVKEARIRLLKEYHPDLFNGNKKYAELKSAEINEAYQAISQYFESKNVLTGETQKEIHEYVDIKEEQYNKKDRENVINQLKTKIERKKINKIEGKNFLDGFIFFLLGILVILFFIFMFS